MDWNEVKLAYITDPDSSYRKVAAMFGISRATLSCRAQQEGWPAAKQQHQAEIMTKTLDVLADHQAERLARLTAVTDKLLGKLEQAVEELHIQLAKKTVKEKVIEYRHEERPDKPTKETVTEQEEILEVRTVIDRAGIKAISSALRDIKEIQMLRSELDRREQEARIANLEKQVGTDDDDTVTVVINGSAEEFCC